MKRVKRLSWLIIVFLSMPALAQETEKDTQEKPEQQQEVQEVKYVTDKLRLSLYKKSNDRGGTIKLLVSGDVLDVLEKSGPYSKVRTREGVTGWVKNGFLVSEPTASFQLVEEQKKNEILARQIEQFADTQKLVDDYENTISLINEDLQTTQSKLEQANKDLEQLSATNTALNEQIEATQQGKLGWLDIMMLLKQFWYVAVLALLIMLLVGFMVGRSLVEAQVRKRFQGVKVW